MDSDATFHGAKLALFLGEDLVVILRDDRPDLVWPGYWDLPGGGREGGETPLACALRETHEELGLVVPENAIVWSRAFSEGTTCKWFFVAHMPASTVELVQFGDEGQKWKLMTRDAFLGHDKAVPMFKARLAQYLDEIGE